METFARRFKSRERPRIHRLLNKLTNLRMNSTGGMRDSLMRAEEFQLNLTDVGENVSNQTLCSIVLKGLPNSFASFETVFKFSHEAKTFADLKRDLLDFDSDSCRGQTDQGTSSHFTKDVKCIKCGKIDQGQSECRARVSAIVCYECGEKGHKANECPNRKIGRKQFLRVRRLKTNVFTRRETRVIYQLKNRISRFILVK